MSFYAISALINFITSSVLGILVISKGRNSKNVGFFTFCFFVAFWSLGYFLWQISTTAEEALFWCRTLMIGAIFIPVAYLHFVYALVDILDKRKNFLKASYVLFSLFLISIPSPYLIDHMEPALNFKFWPIAGPIYSLFLMVWFFYVIYSTFLLFQKYRTSAGMIRLQIKYVMLGMVVGFIGGSTNYFLWYKVAIPPVANILVSVYVGAIAYAIIRYRLMDIRIVARKISIYIAVTAFVYAAFYFMIWFYDSLFGGAFTDASLALGILVAPLFVLGFYTVDKGVRTFANEYLFASLYNYQETINDITDELTDYINLDKIINLIIDTIEKTMKLDRSGILLIDTGTTPVHYQIAKVIGFSETDALSLVEGGFLTGYLSETEKPLVNDELLMLSRDPANVKDAESFVTLYGRMDLIEASLCLPLMSNKRLIGIVVLGSKISKDAYTNEDLELLNTLSKQASIAIENALQYKQIQDFGRSLQSKVDEQTKDLENANIRLKELDRQKSEFVSLASHQLRAPVTAIKGYGSMLLDGDFGEIGGGARDAVDKMYQSAQGLATIVSDYLDVSRIEQGRMQYDFSIFSMKDLVSQIITELKPNIVKARLDLDFVPDSRKEYMVNADKGKMRQVIGNLIDNSIKYTSHGGIRVSIAEIDGDFGKKVLVTISDTGIGIRPDVLPMLFEKFTRAPDASKTNIIGTGLGLYVAEKMMEAHHGRVWAESPGEGKGSNFFVELNEVEK